MNVFACTCMLAGTVPSANTVRPIKVQMSVGHWHTLPADSMGPKGEAQFLRKEGFPDGLLVLKAGSAALDGLSFRDGTIEYDFKPLAPDMPGLQFRVSGTEASPEGEEVYERMFGDERASNDGIQYVPLIHGFMPWNAYPQYQNRAPMIDGWNHVRVVVSGRRMKVFINRSTDAVLSVGNLESGSASGAVHLRGPAIFTNLIVTPGEVGGLASEPELDPTARETGIIREWQASSLQSLVKLQTPAYSEMPSEANCWHPVDSERGGLLNLNRQYVASEGPPMIGWLRFNVTAKHAESKLVSLGWIGEVWIFANGTLLTTGKNFYYPEKERREPDGRMAFENGSFKIPLHAGTNEIAIALYASVHDDLRTRTKYGWGLMMRFQDPSGLTFPRSTRVPSTRKVDSHL
ncbi:hypothetical protein [Granulicella arctica]|uniref:hypothetical protein n=1 Tax=Granulicella arctica TaxID=940613 RepID=UPI0021E0A8AA|nr:hypothetical protein [Granulicella arctica]